MHYVPYGYKLQKIDAPDDAAEATERAAKICEEMALEFGEGFVAVRLRQAAARIRGEG